MTTLDARFSPMDAPAVAGFSLVFQPASVFASSSSTLTLVVSVPLGGDPVTMDTSNNIRVTFPSADADPAPPVALVTTLFGITTTSPTTWSILGPRGGKFTIAPLDETTLNPGDSLQFIFRGLSIVPTLGKPDVTIDVNSSAGSATTSWPINVQANTPGIIAWADPPTVALNATSTLRWVSVQGTFVRVSGFTTGNHTHKDFPVGGRTNWPVNPTVDIGSGGGSNHPYPVVLYSNPGEQQEAATSVTVFLHSPYISQFVLVHPDKTVSKKITINYGESVTARWSCVFVDPEQGVTVSYGSTETPNPAVSEDTFNPSSALAPNDDKVEITLTAPGWNTPAIDTVEVRYRPVRILYFKYTQWTSDAQGDHFTDMAWLTDPATVQDLTVSPDPTHSGVMRLSVQGPGGPFTQYLGTGTEPYLEIRYFSPTAAVSSGKPFTLQWFTNGATSLTLAQSGQPPVSIPQQNIAKGTSQPLTITGPTEYVLTATGAGGTVQSYLNVTPA